MIYLAGYILTILAANWAIAADCAGAGVMTFLSGGVPPGLVAAGRPDLGIMLGPGKGNRAPLVAGLPWAADNGCFTHGDAFDVDRWLA